MESSTPKTPTAMRINDILKQVPAWAQEPKADMTKDIEKAVASYTWDALCIAPDMRAAVLWHDIDLLLAARADLLEAVEEMEQRTSPDEDFGAIIPENNVFTPEEDKVISAARFKREKTEEISDLKGRAKILSRTVRLISWNLAEYGCKFCSSAEIRRRQEDFNVSLDCLSPCMKEQPKEDRPLELQRLPEKEARLLWKGLSEGGFLQDCPEDLFLAHFSKTGTPSGLLRWYDRRNSLTTFALFCVLLTRRLLRTTDKVPVSWEAFASIFGSDFVTGHKNTLEPYASNWQGDMDRPGSLDARRLRKIFGDIEDTTIKDHFGNK